MKPLPVLALLILLAAFAEARAQATYSLPVPEVPAGQPVSLRVDTDDGCYEVQPPVVVRNGQTVAVEFIVSDFVVTPCPAAYVTPLHFALGSFAAGNYTVEVTECVFGPVPCQLHTVLPLAVGGVGAVPGVPATIPAIGAIAGILLGVAAVVLALVKLTGPRAATPR